MSSGYPQTRNGVGKLGGQLPATPIIFFLEIFFFFCRLFAFSRAALAAYEGSQARGHIGAAAASLRQSHSNAGSEPHLQPTPQLMTTLDP